MRFWIVLAAVFVAGGAGAQERASLVSREVRVSGEGAIALVSLVDERVGARHVKWLSRIEVRRIPE